MYESVSSDKYTNCPDEDSRAPLRHPYFDVVMGLERPYDPESYAGGSLLLVGSPIPDRSKVMTQNKRVVLGAVTVRNSLRR